MRYLLDTHTLLWAALEPERLSKAAGSVIESTGEDLLVSTVSLWEIGILRSLGRIQLNVSIQDLANLSVSELGAELIAIEPKHIDRMARFPFHHRDPFDRLLAAQALEIKAIVIGKDAAFDSYGAKRVW